MSDIANLFPYVMDRKVELQSETVQLRELPISDAKQKGIKTDKKWKYQKAAIKLKQKKAAVKPTDKKPDEVANDANTEDSYDDFDNPPWKKTKSDPKQPVIEKTQQPSVARSSKTSKTRKRSTTIKTYLPLTFGNRRYETLFTT
ncbi:hypothetical protein Hanom_Chr06g00519771 [Helianthus anomalus]